MLPELKKSETISTKTMGHVDVDALLREDIENESKGIPLRIGYGFDVNYGLKDGTWENYGSWRIWSLKIVSSGAFSLSFVFDDLYLAPGAQLNIFNSEGSMVFGPSVDDR